MCTREEDPIADCFLLRNSQYRVVVPNNGMAFKLFSTSMERGSLLRSERRRKIKRKKRRRSAAKRCRRQRKLAWSVWPTGADTRSQQESRARFAKFGTAAAAAASGHAHASIHVWLVARVLGYYQCCHPTRPRNAPTAQKSGRSGRGEGGGELRTTSRNTRLVSSHRDRCYLCSSLGYPYRWCFFFFQKPIRSVANFITTTRKKRFGSEVAELAHATRRRG